jgi:hypothetical protein
MAIRIPPASTRGQRTDPVRAVRVPAEPARAVRPGRRARRSSGRRWAARSARSGRSRSGSRAPIPTSGSSPTRTAWRIRSIRASWRRTGSATSSPGGCARRRSTATSTSASGNGWTDARGAGSRRRSPPAPGRCTPSTCSRSTPRVGLMRGGDGGPIVEALDACRIRWGRVVATNGDSSRSRRSRSETVDGRLTLGAPTGRDGARLDRRERAARRRRARRPRLGALGLGLRPDERAAGPRGWPAGRGPR